MVINNSPIWVDILFAYAVISSYFDLCTSYYISKE